MLFRSVWIAAWLIDGVNTHTFGPKVAVSASGHRLDARLGAEAAAGVGDEPMTAALAGTAASTPATSAAARISGLAITRITCTPLSFVTGKSQQDCNA